jgi:SAM-dependent methyltransferase
MTAEGAGRAGDHMGRYDPKFYADLEDGARSAANRVLPIVMDLVRPRSVVDVGCGAGDWLSALQGLSDCDILGIDGAHVSPDQLKIPAESFRAVDLAQELSLGRKFDLAMSLEVAEHLAPDRAAGFVADLAGLAPAVLFSAAVPTQGGVHHINEQWQSYWVDLFDRVGFAAWDVIRPKIWMDAQVEFYYRQNMFLFVDRTATLTRPDDVAMLVDVVHPEMLERVRRDNPPLTLRSLVARFPSVAREAARHRVSAARGRWDARDR